MTNTRAVSEAATADALKRCGIDPDQTDFGSWRDRTYARAVESFALFIQEVSDAAKAAYADLPRSSYTEALAPFILPEPVDELAEVVAEAAFETLGETWDQKDYAKFADQLRRRGIALANQENSR